MEHLPVKGFVPSIWLYLCDCCVDVPEIESSILSFMLPANLGHLEEMCIGNFKTSKVNQAFMEGADGVLLCGCQVGHCQTAGNVEMLRIIHKNQIILSTLGIEPQRLGQIYLAPDCPRTLQASVEGFIAKIEKMGPASVQKKNCQG